MMYKKKTSLRLRLLTLLIPAVGAGIAMAAIPAAAGTLESFAQTSESRHSATTAKNTIKDPEERVVYTEVEKEAMFPGGAPALMKFLKKKVKYPIKAFKAKEEGRVLLQFVVEKNGSIKNIRIMHGASESLNKEAVRVIKKMPKWIPAKLNSQPVASYVLFPIVFRLNNN